MNNELLRELRDAGFPIIEHANRAPETHSYRVTRNYKMVIEHLYEPSLGELIEATPLLKRVFRAGVENDFWRAESDEPEVFESGSTPTEAVARLWLALNKTKK